MSSKSPIESDVKVLDTTTPALEYEVFLSFRGPDTKVSFTSHLYTRLVDAGIRVFIDDKELREGEKIGPELLKGIKESKIAIPIFSKGYAESKWCLKELAQIVECKRTTGLKVMPIFYDVTPSDVRNQTGGYEEAFKLHGKCHEENTITDWKKALREVGELKGWDIKSGTDGHRQEGEIVKKVTSKILHELTKAHLVMTDYCVGLDHHIKEVITALATKVTDAKIVGIHGMGGIGKTTLGKAIYNHLLPDFENHYFLADIRETAQSKGMELLQKRLISDILNEEGENIFHIDEGIRIIKERFSNKKVLLLLDDVDKLSQVRSIMGNQNWFGLGSTIIITTRNKSIIDSIEGGYCYELNELESHHALQLFSLHAFRRYQPPEEYAILSNKIVGIAGGLPLALEILGSSLYGKSKKEWDSMVKKLDKVPHDEVCAKLRISFEGLKKEQKEMFLDIACFLIGEDERIAIHFWDESEFPEEGIEVLQQMSLIKIKKDHLLWMHDQLRDVAREIVRQEHKEVERHSRLWNEEEAMKVVMQKAGSNNNVQGINLNFRKTAEHSNLNEEFARLQNLRFLRVNGLDYKSYEGI